MACPSSDTMGGAVEWEAVHGLVSVTYFKRIAVFEANSVGGYWGRSNLRKSKPCGIKAPESRTQIRRDLAKERVGITTQRIAKLAPLGHGTVQTSAHPNRVGTVKQMVIKGVDLRQRDTVPGSYAHPVPLVVIWLEREGRAEDHEEAIMLWTRAIEFVPDSHPDKPTLLNNLGTSLRVRYERSGNTDDLEKAIELQNRAAGLTPDINFGNALVRQFNRLGNLKISEDPLKDLGSAITLKARAVDLTPDDYPDKPAQLNSLANSLQDQNSLRERFDRVGVEADLEEAIRCSTRSLGLLPGSHSERARTLRPPGAIFVTHLCSPHAQADDATRAMEAFLEAMQHTPSPLEQLQASGLCTQLLSKFSHLFATPSKVQLLEAYKNALGLIPQYIWLSNNVRGRYTSEELSVAQTIVNDTATAAVSAGEYCRALEWLEAGQAIVWPRIPRLRTLDDYGNSTLNSLKISVRFPRHCISTPALNPTLSLRQQPSAIPLMNKHRARMAMLCSNGGDCDDRGGYLPGKGGRHDPTYKILGDLWVLVVKPILDVIHTLLTIGTSTHAKVPRVLIVSQGVAVNGAVTAAISAGEYGQALEWLETGRAAVWSQILQLRTLLEDLQILHPHLADELRKVSQALQYAATSPSSIICIDSLPTTSSDALHTRPSLEDQAQSSHTYALEYEELITEIRELEGFQNFLRPKTFPQLAGACYAGPTLGFGAIRFLSRRRGGEMRDEYSDDRGGRVTAMGPPDMMRKILADLRNQVVKPIMDAVCTLVPTTLPHITWCPTGPLAFLPFHAAGIYSKHEGTSTHSQTIVDIAVSSYTPTLEALLKPRTKVTAGDTEYPKALLVVSQQTATGDETLSEEAVHLAAGMLNVGYKSVVGTMWSISDYIAPDVMREFYTVMEEQVKAGGELQPAYALHEAMKALRSKPGRTNDFLRVLGFGVSTCAYLIIL
ncbi:hypothetical protein BDY19DRAFT_910303 [Irpex rosettiformis]|uniref:Uncharacterized protein n=1 Tax=Irpex rosettiformis TaxID=378272 RepID=A0ACB8TP76_9APHY|nr:hypothetical protein BDY19DRAFT_910303 [Irpex rosettiformis]